MTVYEAYRRAWSDRSAVVPLFLAVRALSAALIVPLFAVLIPLALSVSGQAALTDQDIAYFFLTPIGFVVFLILAALLLIGSVLGVAAMTVNLHQGGPGSLASLEITLRLLVRRIPALISYAVQLTMRVLLIVAPFALVSLFVADRLISAFDINYYLSSRPPEFVQAVIGIGAIVIVMIGILLNRLLLWAVSLHLVLFEDVSARQSFRQSAEIMQGQRIVLVQRILAWAAVRVLLILGLALVFGFLMSLVVEAFSTALRAMLTLALVVAAVWAITNFVVSALSLGALARLLDALYNDGDPSEDIAPQEARAGVSVAVFAGVTIVLLGVSAVFGGFILNRIETQTDVEVIGHRGAAGARPENTLAAIQKAVEDQADWVEIDVQETADGQVVVMHDSDFMKQAGVDLKIWNATMADLSQIDIGGWFDPSYSDQRTITLSDALDVVRDKSKLLIELKYYGHDVDLEARTIAIVEAAGMSDQVATMSLKYPAVQKMKDLRPDWDAGVLAATAIGDLSRLDADFIAVSTGVVGPRLIRSAEAAGKKLYAWTVNDPIEMSAMISLGVDGLITDEPALARQVLEFRAGLNSAERVFLLFVERFGLDLVPDLIDISDS